MKVLSLFDGMSCGVLAMMESGVPIDRYVAYEIDKYAIQTSTHNFPFIEHKGDVFKADFTEFEGFDWLIGGSPCTYWSIAQTNNRETTASGMGWELFSQYVRALHEAKPKYFIYENNKSMSVAIKESISEAFGFEPVLINSALVSAQNRQRLYWVGRRNEDGTYSKVDVPQPQDRGILLKDVLEDGCCVDKDKAYCLKHQAGNARDYFKKHHTQIKFEPVPINTTDNGEKARCLMAGYYKYGTATLITNEGFKGGTTAVAEPVKVGSLPKPNGELSKSQSMQIYSVDGKSATQCACGGGLGAKTGLYAVPVRVGCMPSPDGEVKNSQGMRVYSTDGKAVSQTAQGGGLGAKTGLYAVPVNTSTYGASGVAEQVGYRTIENAIPDIVDKYGYLPEMFNAYNRAEIKDKAPTLSTGSMHTSSCAVNCIAKIPCFAVPVEWDEEGKPIKARSCADGKIYTVYEVKDGKITIKGKEYPIKLPDGFYIIRKLTVRECMRLQTVPEWYEFPVFDSQAYKMLGNGWTVAVISWLIDCTLR